MEGISPVWPGDLLFHKSLDGGRALDRTKSTYPFPVLREKSREYAAKSPGVEVAAIVEQDSLDFLNVLQPLDACGKSLAVLANSGISVTRKMRLARMAFTSTRVYHGAYSPSKKSVLTFFTS